MTGRRGETMVSRREFSELTRVQIPAALHLMRLGYTYLPHNGKEIMGRDPETNILISIFREQFLKFNNYATDLDVERELNNIKIELDQNDLGRAFYNRIVSDSGPTYVDWENPENNTFHLALEVTCQNGGDEFRPDIVIFINGLPLSYIEVKQPNAIRDGKTAIQSEQSRTAVRFENRRFRRFNNITQLISFSDNLPYISGQGQQKQGSFYCSNAFSKTKFNAFKEEREEELIYSIRSLGEEEIDAVLKDVNRFALKSQPEFKTNQDPSTPCNTFISSLYQKERLLFLLRYGLAYVEEHSKDGTIQLQKHVMRYPQFFATKAIEDAIGKGVKKGVIWHTQGSGKSLSMVFYAHLLQDALDSPTVVVMTDRIDLDDQLYLQFSQCADFLRQTPVQAESKEHLKALLDGRSANGIIFTTMFKFERGEKPLSERRNIVVMADEAHRGQYGFDEKIVISKNEDGEKEAHTVIGNARIIHDALPNATFIGFTGTPISAKDRNTREVFGEYMI